MKPENIEARMRELKRDALRSFILNSLLHLPLGLLLLWIAFRENLSLPIRLVALAGAVYDLVSIPLAWRVLRRRYREIESGEEIDAEKY